VELDVAEWRAAPVEKAGDAVGNTAAGGWPGGEEGWRATALEHGGERGRWPVGRCGERHGGVVALEHATVCGRDGAMNGEELGFGEWRRWAHKQTMFS
jgi:hypothetical protein